jgi:hypothetical protein
MNKFILPTLALTFAACIANPVLDMAHAAPASKSSVQKHAVPTQLLGKWGFTSISGTTYWDKSTGAYMGSGNGGSQTYTFYPNGTYKFFNYIKTNSYGWEMQALTWEEGTVSANPNTGSITLRPTSGRYQVMDNRVSKNNYKRPMKASERKVKTMTWRIESKDNKPVLQMGRDASSLIDFKKQP